jgi:hypothetical protein
MADFNTNAWKARMGCCASLCILVLSPC